MSSSQGVSERPKIKTARGHKPEPIASPESVSGPPQGNGETIQSLRSVRAQVEVTAILGALKRTGWNRKQAARLLSISYRGLLYKIRRHNIAPQAEQSDLAPHY